MCLPTAEPGKSDGFHFYLYACELSTCYDQRRYERRLRVLDKGPSGVYNVRLDDATLRWTDSDDGQEKSAAPQ